MKTLSIETTNKICSSAISEDGKVLSIVESDAKNMHSVVLVPNIKKMMDSLNLTIYDIDNIFVSNGPGSYTGIRIGISTAMGLAKANKTKIYYVNTLYSLSKNVKTKFDFIITLLDARVNRVYFAIFNREHIQIGKNLIVDIDDFVNLTNRFFMKKYSFYIVGDGVEVYREKLSKLKCKYKIGKGKENILSAKSLCEISMNYDENNVKSVLDINYMQKSNAERNNYA